MLTIVQVVACIAELISDFYKKVTLTGRYFFANQTDSAKLSNR